MTRCIRHQQTRHPLKLIIISRVSADFEYNPLRFWEQHQSSLLILSLVPQDWALLGDAEYAGVENVEVDLSGLQAARLRTLE